MAPLNLDHRQRQRREWNWSGSHPARYWIADAFDLADHGFDDRPANLEHHALNNDDHDRDDDIEHDRIDNHSDDDHRINNDHDYLDFNRVNDHNHHDDYDHDHHKHDINYPATAIVLP